MFLKFVCFVLFISPLMGAALSEKKGAIEECQEQLACKDRLKKGVLRKLQGLRYKKDVSDDDKATALALIERVVTEQRFIPWQRAFWCQAWYELGSADKKDEVVKAVIKTYQGREERLFESDLKVFQSLLKTPAMVGELTTYLGKMLELQRFEANSHLSGLLLFMQYGTEDQKAAAIEAALLTIDKQLIITMHGWRCLKEALKQAKEAARGELVESILNLTDPVQKPALSIRCYTLVLPWADLAQKENILKASWAIYEGKIAAETEMSLDDFQYFHKIESNTHEPRIRDGFQNLLATPKKRDAVPVKS